MASNVYMIPIDPNRPVNEVYDNSEQLSYKEDVRTLLKSNLNILNKADSCLLYTSPSPRDKRQSRMPSSA